MRIVILTGYSGSGKSTALRYIEEHGYYCVDNLPATLLGDLVKVAADNGHRRLAVVMDARGREFLVGAESVIQNLKKKHDVRLAFFDSDLISITQRYQEHRLRHPLALRGTVREGFESETRWLSGLRQQADLIINTSSLNVHSLKSLIKKYFTIDKHKGLEVKVMSFGFKYGAPAEADLVFDARVLINPFFEPTIKKKSGKTQTIAKFILKDPLTQRFIEKTMTYVKFFLGVYENKSKPFVTLAFGCTGGMHRSVFMAEMVAKQLKQRYRRVTVSHRDLGRE